MRHSEALPPNSSDVIIARSIEEMGMHVLPLAKFAADWDANATEVAGTQWFRGAVRRGLIDSDGTMHPDVRAQLVAIHQAAAQYQSEQPQTPRPINTSTSNPSRVSLTTQREIPLREGLGNMLLRLLLKGLEEYGTEAERNEVREWLREVAVENEALSDVPNRYAVRYAELQKKYRAQQIYLAVRSISSGR